MRKAFEGMLGACLGNLCLIALSALGLGLIISQNEILFNAIKWLGAGYLAFLGIQIIRKPSHFSEDIAAVTPVKKSFWMSSFFIAVSNPKGLIYFGALLPQFISYEEPIGLQFFILITIILAIDLAWMFAYAAAGNKIMQWLKKPEHQRLFNYISGAVLIAVGLAMALSGKN